MWPNLHLPEDLITFAVEILNGKLHFLFITGNYFAESLITKDNQKLKHEKSQDAKACNFMKKRLWNSCFPVNFSKFLRTSFYRTPPGNLRKRTDFRDLTSMMELSPNRFSGYKYYFLPYEVQPYVYVSWANNVHLIR